MSLDKGVQSKAQFALANRGRSQERNSAKALSLALTFLATVSATVAVPSQMVTANAAVGIGRSPAYGVAAAAAGTSIGSGRKTVLAQPMNPYANMQRLQEQRKQQQQMRQQEINSLHQQLSILESRPSDNLEECSQWDQMNARYTQIVGQQQVRAGEIQKRHECDELSRRTGEAQSRVESLRQLMVSSDAPLEFVGNLVHEYMSLRNDMASDEHLAKEFDILMSVDEDSRLGFEQVEHFMDYMSSLLIEQPADTADADADANDLSVQSSERFESDDLGELDSTLRRMIDRELELSEEETEQLAEFAGFLDKILSSGQVDLASGKFRYLSGTLDAARAVLLRRTLANGVTRVSSVHDQLDLMPESRAQLQFGLNRPMDSPESKREAQIDEDEFVKESRALAKLASESLAAQVLPTVKAANTQLAVEQKPQVEPIRQQPQQMQQTPAVQMVAAASASSGSHSTGTSSESSAEPKVMPANGQTQQQQQQQQQQQLQQQQQQQQQFLPSGQSNRRRFNDHQVQATRSGQQAASS